MHCVFPPKDGLPHWYGDPGADRIALAIFRDRHLAWYGFLDASFRAVLRGEEPTFLGIEKPQIYQTTATAQANDCLDVWGSACWFRSRVHALNPSVVERVLKPEEWKAQLPKPVHHARLWESLTDRERRMFPADTEERIRIGVQRGRYTNSKGNEVHNLLDATGIGLFCEGRTGRGGVVIRL
jgi:hypothetical protein